MTPGVLATSYRCKVETKGFILRRRERGWPMPPLAPRTATLNPGAAPRARVGSMDSGELDCGGEVGWKASCDEDLLEMWL